jgi:hypothetical protein
MVLESDGQGSPPSVRVIARNVTALLAHPVFGRAWLWPTAARLAPGSEASQLG